MFVHFVRFCGRIFEVGTVIHVFAFYFGGFIWDFCHWLLVSSLVWREDWFEVGIVVQMSLEIVVILPVKIVRKFTIFGGILLWQFLQDYFLTVSGRFLWCKYTFYHFSAINPDVYFVWHNRKKCLTGSLKYREIFIATYIFTFLISKTTHRVTFSVIHKQIHSTVGTFSNILHF